MTSAEDYADRPVDYAAVGASEAADLMQFPPEGFTPFSEELRLGSGRARYDQAVAQLLGWGAQRGAGVSVQDVHVPAGDRYLGIRYAEDGAPLEQVRASGEQRFAADGVPYATAGATAKLHGRIGRHHLSGIVRVVWLVEERTRAGFGLGSVEASTFRGEQAFVIELRDDDSVWFLHRGFSQPVHLTHRLFAPLHRRRQRAVGVAYARAMSPAWATGRS